MTSIEELKREIEALRARSSSLNAAIQRISASLDVDTVLREVVDSARALTGSRYGAIVTVDDAGRLVDFLASGFTPEQHRRMLEWPHGEGLFEHLRDLEAPLRVADFSAWLRSIGYAPEALAPPATLQATPMRHRGEHLGGFFLGDKEGGEEFTDEDQEVLVLFASQAATAIANARTYRDEQRARADLEALVETSPVGVVVFDAPTGKPVSFNREANRIVSGLRIEGHPLEHLLEVMTCRYPDGREIALAELPLTEVLRGAMPLRAGQIELSVPDGRRVSVLVNATPIRSAAGEVVRLIVTLQDLAALQELERLRTEFLRMVSHELRAPLVSIKGSTATVLGTARVLESGEVRQFFRIIDEQANRMDGLIGDLLDAGRIEAGTLSVSPEPVPVAALVDRARNTFVSGGGRHALQIDLPRDLPRVMADERRVVQVLNNLLANAAGASSVTTPIRIDAAQQGIYLEISVADEGRGIAPEQLAGLFRKYTGLAGEDAERGPAAYGLGLAICKGLVEAHGGRIRATSAGIGQGSRFTFTLPVAAQAGEAAVAAAGRRESDPGEPEPARILVLDDDPEALRFVRDTLTDAGYAALVTGDPAELADLVRTKRPHLVLLDLMLPGSDGIELLRRVPGLAELPVIFISVYGRDETIAQALQAGAVDYIVKPFSPTELTARIEAALRVRARPAAFVLGELSIEYHRRRVRLADRILELTATEYELLRVLSLNAGRVVTHETLLRQVWGARHDTGQNVVRTYVRRLRDKLGDDAAAPVYIFTQFRVGYRMPDPSDPDPNVRAGG